MTVAPADHAPGHAVSVACDGGGGALGHPKVYLELDAEGKVCCPYCSRLYRADETGHVSEVKA